MKRLEKQEAIKLRFQGRSYNEIRRILGIPSKGTLSYWFKNLPLSPTAKKRLAHNRALAQKRGLLRFNRERTKAIGLENRDSFVEGREAIGTLSKRELLLVGAALYWGEGTKKPGRNNAAAVLVNSDSSLIGIFIRFVREILEVPEERIRTSIQIHPNVSAQKAKRFWSKITKLPMDRFYIITQVSRASKFKRPKKSLPNGTISIKVNKRMLFYKIKGYIEGLCTNIV